MESSVCTSARSARSCGTSSRVRAMHPHQPDLHHLQYNGYQPPHVDLVHIDKQPSAMDIDVTRDDQNPHTAIWWLAHDPRSPLIMLQQSYDRAFRSTTHQHRMERSTPHQMHRPSQLHD